MKRPARPAKENLPPGPWFGEHRNVARLILGFFLIVVAATCFLSYTHHQDATEDALREDRATARLLSLLLEEHFRKIVVVMQSYAGRPLLIRAVRDRSADGARPHLARLLKDLPAVAGVAVTDPKGTLWLRHPPLPEVPGINFAHGDWFEGPRREGKPCISVVYPRIVGEKDPAVTAAVPVIDTGGQIVGILASAHRMEALRGLLSRISFPAGTTALMTDREGRLVYSSAPGVPRHPAPHPFATLSGRTRTDEPVTATVQAPGSDGTRYVSFATVDGPGWKVFVSRDARAILLSEWVHYLQIATISVLLFLLFSLSLILLGKQALSRHAEEQSRNERRLQASEERYRTILNEMEEGYHEVDLAGRFTFFNEAFPKLFGYDRDEMTGTSFRRYALDKETADRVFREYRRMHETGVPIRRSEWDIVRKDGARRTLEFSASILRDLQDRPIGFRGVVRDTTERRRAEAAVRERDALFRKLSAHVPGMIYQFLRRPDGTYCLPFATEAVREIFGCAPDEVREDFAPIARAILPEDFDGVIASIEASAAAMKTWEFEYRVRLPGQPVRWMYGQSTPEKLPGGGILWHGFIADVTERKHWAEALQASRRTLEEAERKYRSIVENAQEGIFQSTPEGRYLSANQALATLLGYNSPEDLMSSVTDIAGLYANPEDRRRLLALAEERGIVTGYETQYVRKDGRIIWASLNERVVRDDDGRTLFYEGFLEDITSRKMGMEQIRMALEATVQAIAVTVEARDPYTAGHQRRVSDLARAVAVELGLPAERIDGLQMAARLHDLGKISVPAEILSKPSRLTELEFNLMKMHPQAGYDILKDIEFPWPIARMVLEHHERVDGSGYPNGLTGETLMLESRVLAVADVVESMASHRPYRPAIGLDKALEEIVRHRGVLYDTEAVDACLAVFRKGYRLQVAQ